MLTTVHPKLPMSNKTATRAYYQQLGFEDIGRTDYAEYLIMRRDAVELHFFLHPSLDPFTNDGQVYIRTDAIDELYRDVQQRGVAIHPNAPLQDKPWGQREFALLDPDHNLLTFGQSI